MLNPPSLHYYPTWCCVSGHFNFLAITVAYMSFETSSTKFVSLKYNVISFSLIQIYSYYSHIAAITPPYYTSNISVSANAQNIIVHIFHILSASPLLLQFQFSTPSLCHPHTYCEQPMVTPKSLYEFHTRILNICTPPLFNTPPPSIPHFLHFAFLFS